MIKQTRALLYYLRRYLEANPGKRAELVALYKKTTGKELDRRQLWRHTQLKTNRAPEADIFFFYLIFLTRQKAIAPDPKNLFTYAHPSLLTAKKK